MLEQSVRGPEWHPAQQIVLLQEGDSVAQQLMTDAGCASTAGSGKTAVHAFQTGILGLQPATNSSLTTTGVWAGDTGSWHHM